MPPKDSLESIYKKYANKEMALGKEDFWSQLGGTDYNPDKINITTYIKMLQDAQVYSASRVRNLAVFSKGIDLEYHGEKKDLGLEMRRYLRKAFVNVNRNDNQNGGIYFPLDQMFHNGTSFGYSVAETVFGEYNEYGDGYIYPKKLKVLPPKTLKNCFSIDDYGNLEKIVQNKDGTNEVTFDSEVDLDRLLVYTHARMFSDWYGQSDLKNIYKNWFIKDYLIKFWNITLERYGSPILLGKVSNPGNIDAMNTVLDSMRTKSNISVYAADNVEILEPTSQQREAFMNAIKYHDSQIMLGKLIPLLLLGLEQTGARALGDVHFRVFLWTIKNDQKEVANFVDLWIRKLIDMNFSEVDAYPRLSFPIVANEDLTTLSDALFKLVNTNIISPDESWIRDVLSIPDNDIIESTGGMWRSKDILNIGSDIEFVGDNANSYHRISSRKELVYDPKMKEFEKLMDNTEVRVENIYKDYLDLQMKRVIDDPNSFKRTKAEEQNLITKLRLLLTGWGEEVIDFEDNTFREMELQMNTAFSRDALNDYISQLSNQSFKESVADIAHEAKEIVLDGQKEGLSHSEITTAVSEVYDQYKTSMLTTVVRTITNDVNNAARLELYKNNSDFVNGLRYDAILDKRTTDFCEIHDGMQIPLNHPDVDAFRPPNHFRCRSMYTPVTILDGKFKDTYDIGNIYPADRFGRDYFDEKYGGIE